MTKRSWRSASSSTVRAMAFSVAAAFMLVPANLLPVMHTARAGHPPWDATILSGVRQLLAEDLWGLAAIVFTASIVVPALKLGGMACLLWGVRQKEESHTRSRRLTRLYVFLDFIGRWSMLDVFLVAFLSGAVRFGQFAVVQPRSGIIAFAAVVFLTMLATHSFDPRLLWPPSRSSRAATAT